MFGDETLKADVRRILVIKLRAVGDVLVSTVVLDNLRQAFPDASIDFLTESASRDVVINHPAVNDVVVYHRKKDSMLRFFFMLHKRKYDLVIDLFCNPKSAQMTFATRARRRVGFPFRGRAWAYNVKAKWMPESWHGTEFNLDALRSIGVPILSKIVKLYLTETERAWARSFLAPHRIDGQMLVALNPGSSCEARRWGSEHYAELGDMLFEKLDARVLLVWGPGEEHEARGIAGMMKHPAIIAPKTTILQLGALLAECSFTVSNDTGPIHISAAVDTPPLGIYGPTFAAGHRAFHPKSAIVRLESLDCLECSLLTCTIGNMCMRDLTAAMVYEAFEKMIELSK